MLASKLNTLVTQSSGCRLKDIMASLSKDDAQALNSAIQNPAVSIRGIYSALRSEGIMVGRETITKGRDCSVNATNCKCGLFVKESK
jgi:hypothetical protein